MTRSFTDFARAALAILLLAATASFAYGGLPIKDSADFDWKYEWTNANEYPDIDMDDRSGGDFWDVSNSKGTRTTAPGGYLQFSSTAASQNEQWQSDGHSGHPGNVWAGRFTFAQGWTIEAAIQVISGVTGKLYTCDIGGGMATDGGPQGSVAIGVAGQGWGGVTYVPLGTGTYDNTDGYHVFRVAQNPGSATYSVWRDGELLTATQPPVFSGPYDRCFLGDTSSQEGGTAKMDYFRFTAGAWAPIPEPSMLVMLVALGVGGLLFVGRRRQC